MDENRIGRKQDWTKSFGPKQVGRKQVGRKLGARATAVITTQEVMTKIGHSAPPLIILCSHLLYAHTQSVSPLVGIIEKKFTLKKITVFNFVILTKLGRFRMYVF